ncbi:MAG: cation:proton antiporter [Treponema sp.]|nr:cation:proton antiporter [Treponema sp.]
MIDAHIFLVIALILLSTKILAIFVTKIHLPQVIGALVAGVLLGPAVFGIIQPSETISVLAEIGVVLLLFCAGMETDYRQLRSSLKASALISALGVIVALGGGFGIALLFGRPTFESFFVGIVIASMSTSITIEALTEMGKLKTKTGTVLLGASLFDDIFVIVLLAIVMGMGGAAFSYAALALVLVKIVAFFALALGVGLLVYKLFNYMYDRFGAARRLSVFAVAYCFLMAYLAEFFGLADITGAYIAGIAFCSTRCEQFLESRTSKLSYVFFTPIFLVNIGLHTSFAGMTGSLVIFTALLVVVAILSKIIGCGLGAKLSKFTNRESLQVGTGMVARGEVSFIVAAKGIAAGYISSLLFPSIIVVVLATVLVTPLLMKLAFKDKAGVPLER